MIRLFNELKEDIQKQLNKSQENIDMEFEKQKQLNEHKKDIHKF
jgi:hypothetical protein